MNIKKVRISGFERIFEGFQYCFKENRQGFGTGLFNYLSHSLISIELKQLTTIEVMYLKKMATSISVIGQEYGNFVTKEKESDIYQKIDELLKVHDTILHDDDIDKSKVNLDNMLPVGCLQYHVIAIFKGSAITSITGAFIQNLFKEDDGYPELYMGNMHYENKIAEMFYKSFYSYMSTQLKNIDIVSNFMLNKKFYQYIDNSCNLATVNTPFGDIVFFGAVGDRVTKQIEDIRASMQTTPYFLEDKIYLTFSMETTFDTFLELFVQTNYVVDYDPLKLVMLNESINLDDDILVKYNARISNAVDYLVSHKKGLATKEETDINKYNFIFHGNVIRYNIQIPLAYVSGLYNQPYMEKNHERLIIKKHIKTLSDMIKNILS